MNSNKVIMAGGGTGGHIMPAIAIADKLKQRGFEILFIGTKDRMEAKLVPDHGYDIRFIWISALHRGLRLSNLMFPLKIIVSFIQCWNIIRKEKPVFCVGTGGFASGPILYMAAKHNIPIFLQEQNSYPGITTRILGKYAKKIFIAYEDVNKHIAHDHLFDYGNPIRDIMTSDKNINQIKSSMKINHKIVVTIVGGSQGALSINQAFSNILDDIKVKDVHVIWQTGSYSYEQFRKHESESIHILKYIDHMDEIYAISDIIICRAGAITLSELTEVGKATIIIPLKSAAANHQYHNAKSFEAHDAAILIRDDEQCHINLKSHLLHLIESDDRRSELGENIKKLIKKNSADRIVEEILKMKEN